MASADGINPDILFNFNENSATTIRDYSTNSNDGTGSNLTVSATSRSVGYDAVFNGTTSELDTSISSITDSFTVAMAINLGTATGTDYIFDIASGGFKCEWDGTTLTFTLTTNDGASTWAITHNLSTSTWYDIVLKMDDASGDMSIRVDGVEENTQAVTGTFAFASPNIEIGHSSSASYGNFRLNEIKFFDDQDTSTIDDGFINEQNGPLITADKAHGFSLGDLIGYNIGLSEGSYAVVTFVATDSTYRIQPLSNNLRNGMILSRCGHLWDTTRQWQFIIDNTPEICFYDGVTKVSEVGAASKKTFCVTKEGIIKSSSTKTANYTIVSTDQRIYLDSSGGAFTITLEASPTTNRELEIIDSTGDCTAFNVTLAGNGNNIVGAANYTMSTDYEGLRLIFNGTNWNLN